MFLQVKSSDILVEVVDIETLFNPLKNEIVGRIQQGQKEQDSMPYQKQDLAFPSGEDLPRCWMDSTYRT